MPQAEFAEAQFESDLWDDLRSRPGTLPLNHRPTQGAEAYLPFDRAVFTPAELILRTRQTALGGLNTSDPLLASRLPIGSSITLPAYQVNAFLQAKRPMRVSQRNAATAGQWDTWGSAYYRIHIDVRPDRQHSRLIQLERDLAGSALVRYATPCFWTWNDLRLASVGMNVVERTHFQSPSRIGAHGVYTYQNPYGHGIAFSKPERLSSDDLWTDLSRVLSSSEPTTLFESVMRLWHRELDFGLMSLPKSRLAEESRAVRDFLGYRADFAIPEFDRTISGELPIRERYENSEHPRMNLGEFVGRVLRLDRHYARVYGCRWMIVA